MRTLDAGRIDHIRDICQKAIVQDSNVYPHNPNALTDRAWLAQKTIYPVSYRRGNDERPQV